MRSTLDPLQRIFIEPPHSYDTAIRHKSRLLEVVQNLMDNAPRLMGDRSQTCHCDKVPPIVSNFTGW